MNFLQPAIIAAFVAAAISLVVAIINRFTLVALHREKLKFDHELAEKKFKFDQELAESRFKYERDLHDHKRRVELAELLLANFFQASDVIRAIRSPASFAEEAATRPRTPNETEGQAGQLDGYFVPIARIRANTEFISSLLSKRYQGRALLGDSIDEAFQLIDTVLNRIYVSAVALNSMVRRGSAALERHEDRVTRYEADIWNTGTGDQLTLTVDQAIEIARRVCVPILEGSSVPDRGITR